MGEWTKQRLEQMIFDCVEENLSLDYKRAASLNKSDKSKIELTKDVSSFANSTGGVLIYGIAESNEAEKKHLPQCFDPIKRNEVSKEWLDQIIQTIQPRIEGLVIYPVTISEVDNTVCYVIEVPQSHTAHMASDNRYHKRNNFTTAMMADYEVRDVMARRVKPKVRAYIFINKQTDPFRADGLILMRIENYGKILVRDVMADLEVPLDLCGLIHVEKPVISDRDMDGDFFRFEMIPELPCPPLFPGSTKRLRRKIYTNVSHHTTDKHPIKARPYINVSVYADEMPPIRAKLDIASVLAGWTSVH